MENSNGIKEVTLKEITVKQDFKHESKDVTYKLVHHMQAFFERYEVQVWINSEFQKQWERDTKEGALRIYFNQSVLSTVSF